MRELSEKERLSNVRKLGADIALQVVDATPGPSDAMLVMAYVLAHLMRYEETDIERAVYLANFLDALMTYLHERDDK